MNRRGFLTALAAVAATATLDPERLLWRPGKLISIPKPRVATPEFFHLGDVITFEGLYAEPGVLRKFVVCAAGEKFSDIRFQYAKQANALIYPLPTVNLHHSALASASFQRFGNCHGRCA